MQRPAYIVIILLLSTLWLHLSAQGQMVKDSIQLKDLRVPVSPGFALLDLSPTAIESPTSPKMMALQVMNYITSGTPGFPKNFALECAPYWFLKPANETIFKYLSLPDTASSNMAAGILRKLSVSFAVYANDTARVLAPRTSYLSGGLRTNLLTIWGKYAEASVKKFLKTRNEIRQQLLRSDFNTDLNTLRGRIDSAYASNTVNAFTIKPILVLDAAFAYSEAFLNDNFNNKRFNRSAWWLNATMNIPIAKPGKDNFFVIAYYRNLRDNVLTDTAKNLFVVKHADDFGIRAGYESGPFQVSIEHINRNYPGIKKLNTHRTTGILQFKLNDGLFLMGSFGRNFSQEHNLFTMLGINWGIGKQALVL